MLSGAVAERRTSRLPGVRPACADSALQGALQTGLGRLGPAGPFSPDPGPTVLHLWGPADPPAGDSQGPTQALTALVPTSPLLMQLARLPVKAPHGINAPREGTGFSAFFSHDPSSSRRELDLVPKRQTQAFLCSKS